MKHYLPLRFISLLTATVSIFLLIVYPYSTASASQVKSLALLPNYEKHAEHGIFSLDEEPINKVRTQYLFPSTAVIIDAGHGGIDGGAVAGNVYEKDINLAVAKRLYAVLQSRGIPAVLNRTHDYALSEDNRWHKTSSRHLRDLSQRMGLTREIEHVIFVSLHVNSIRNEAAHGPLVIHQHTGESALLAQRIQEQMNSLFNTSRRPVAAKSFYVLKYVKTPAVLIELGFISNPDDRSRLTNPHQQTEIASVIADGLSQYFWIN